MNSVVSVFLISILLSSSFVTALPEVFAPPSLSGYVSGSSSVKVGDKFELSVTVRNSGNAPAYCVSVTMNTPYGFNVSTKNLSFGDIKSGASMSQTIRVTGPSSPYAGTFSGTIKYSDNLNCKGTSYISYVSSFTVNAKDLGQNTVTFTLLSNKRVVAGFVTIYDSKGNYITTGGGQSTCSSCPTKVQVKLSNGDYSATASGKLDGCLRTGFCNALGKADFSVKGNTLVSIYLLPLP